MNAFFVPELGSMIYTMNGMVTQLNLRADAPGTFRGISSHYSGEGFSDMHFETRAVPGRQFSDWITPREVRAPRLDEATYVSLQGRYQSAHDLSAASTLPIQPDRVEGYPRARARRLNTRAHQAPVERR